MSARPPGMSTNSTAAMGTIPTTGGRSRTPFAQLDY
jgi:hypothetical protein